MQCNAQGREVGEGVQAALSILRCMRNYLHPGLAALRESRPASLPTPFLKLSSPAPSCLSHFLVVPPSVAVSASFSALLFCLHNQKERKAPVTIQQNTRLPLVRAPLHLSAILPPAPAVPQTLLSQLPRHPLHPDSGWCSADPRGRGEPRNAPLNLTSTRWRWRRRQQQQTAGRSAVAAAAAAKATAVGQHHLVLWSKRRRGMGAKWSAAEA